MQIIMIPPIVRSVAHVAIKGDLIFLLLSSSLRFSTSVTPRSRGSARHLSTDLLRTEIE